MQPGEKLTQRQERGPTTWRDMLKHVLSDTVNWQTRKLEQLYKVQVLAWMIIKSSRRNRKSVGKVSEVCSQIVLKLLVFGTNWTAWHSMVSQQECEISHKMDSGLWQTLGKSWFLALITRTIPPVLFCVTHGTALHTWLLQDSDFAGDLEQPKSTSGGVLCIFVSPHVCSHELGV